MRKPICERQKFVGDVLEFTYSPPVGGVNCTTGVAVLMSQLATGVVTQPVPAQPTCVTSGTLLLRENGVNGALPQFLLSRLPKLKMSNCTAMRSARTDGSFWRREKSTRCVNGLRQELRSMIRPRCELRQGEALMKLSKSCAWIAADRVPDALNWISLGSSAFFGTYSRSFVLWPSPFRSLEEPPLDP